MFRYAVNGDKLRSGAKYDLTEATRAPELYLEARFQLLTAHNISSNHDLYYAADSMNRSCWGDLILIHVCSILRVHVTLMS